MRRLALLTACVLAPSALALRPANWGWRAAPPSEVAPSEASPNETLPAAAAHAGSVRGRAAPTSAAARRRRTHAEAEEGNVDWAYVMGILGTAVTFIIGYVLEHNHVSWVPEAAVGLMVGCAAARLLTRTAGSQHDVRLAHLDLLRPLRGLVKGSPGLRQR